MEGFEIELGGLPTLVIEPEVLDGTPVVLFLHGAGEAGTDLQGVRVHGPAHRDNAARLPGVIILAPQAPPSRDRPWRWSTYVEALGRDLGRMYAGRRIVGTGFSRGGLGILQLVETNPELLDAWVVVDPAPPPRGTTTIDALLARCSRDRGRVVYGDFKVRDPEDQKRVEEAREACRRTMPNGRFVEWPGIAHNQIAPRAYKTAELYAWLGLEFG